MPLWTWLSTKPVVQILLWYVCLWKRPWKSFFCEYWYIFFCKMLLHQYRPQSRSNPPYLEYQNVQSCIACKGNKDNLVFHNYHLIISMTHLLFLLHSFFPCQTHSYLYIRGLYSPSCKSNSEERKFGKIRLADLLLLLSCQSVPAKSLCVPLES